MQIECPGILLHQDKIALVGGMDAYLKKIF